MTAVPRRRRAEATTVVTRPLRRQVEGRILLEDPVPSTTGTWVRDLLAERTAPTTTGMVPCSPSPIQALQRELELTSDEGTRLGLAVALSALQRVTVEQALSAHPGPRRGGRAPRG